MPNAWDAAGLATSDTIGASGTTTATHYKVTIFSNWAIPSNSYTSLSINVNSKGQETNNTGSDGVMQISYSLNSGSTWNNIHSGGGFSGNWGQVTNTISLSTGIDFTKLLVAACAQGTAGGDTTGTTDIITIWDIWTDGTYTPGASGNGSSQGVPAIQPIFISEVDFRRKYASYHC